MLNSPAMTDGLLDINRIRPKIAAPLDPGFTPAVLFNRRYREQLAAHGGGLRVLVGIEREDGHISRQDLDIIPPGRGSDSATLRYVDRHVKFLLWSRGGWKIHFSGPEFLARHISQSYMPGGGRSADVEIMQRAYDRQFAVQIHRPEDMPSQNETALSLGGNWDGCRIGFDLGASDYKVAAVIDGKPVFSDETPWDPRNQKDPDYHYQHIRSGLKKAAAHLPRVDAIGGSSAGILVNNRVMIASLFRAIPPDVFQQRVKPMFLEMAKEWGVPFEVINDGEVTALAGALSLGTTALLGVAMGSSEAGGYVDRNGKFLGWIDELAFAPVDFSPEAPKDEWSGDAGVGALYFSQQAVNRLLPVAGLSYPAEMSVPERLRETQKLADAEDRRALNIFETIGVYLGYTVPYYAEYYDFDHVLVLGRVTSGAGGDQMMRTANRILKNEFPELAERVRLHVPDEKSRRVGQAVAAASLPQIRQRK